MKSPAQQSGKGKLRIGIVYDIERTTQAVEGQFWLLCKMTWEIN